MAAFLLSKSAHDAGDPRDPATTARAKPEPSTARSAVRHRPGPDAASGATTPAAAAAGQPVSPGRVMTSTAPNSLSATGSSLGAVELAGPAVD